MLYFITTGALGSPDLPLSSSIRSIALHNTIILITTLKSIKFQPYPKSTDTGTLDAAIFDAVNDETIKLWKSGTVLKKDECKNPICIVANYLFDTLYHDIFQVEGDELKEGLISVGKYVINI